VQETLLSYREDAKTSQRTSALFYKDQAGVMDSIEFRGDVAARNCSLVKRRSVATQSREFDMMGRPLIFFQDRYMLNEVGVKIKLIRSKNAHGKSENGHNTCLSFREES